MKSRWFLLCKFRISAWINFQNPTRSSFLSAEKKKQVPIDRLLSSICRFRFSSEILLLIWSRYDFFENNTYNWTVYMLILCFLLEKLYKCIHMSVTIDSFSVTVLTSGFLREHLQKKEYFPFGSCLLYLMIGNHANPESFSLLQLSMACIYRFLTTYISVYSVCVIGRKLMSVCVYISLSIVFSIGYCSLDCKRFKRLYWTKKPSVGDFFLFYFGGE